MLYLKRDLLIALVRSQVDLGLAAASRAADQGNRNVEFRTRQFRVAVASYGRAERLRLRCHPNGDETDELERGLDQLILAIGQVQP